MYISPRHTNEQFPNPPNLEEKVDLFYARIDGWHLEIADRCINGWDENGTPCVTAQHKNEIVHYIPDSGWAVMQIALNYFEIVTVFKQGLTRTKREEMGARKRFVEGVKDVFPNECEYYPIIPDLLWKQFRTSMYHTWTKNSRIGLGHVDNVTCLAYDPKMRYLVVDPHNFVKALRQHLLAYVSLLHNHSQTELRSKFLIAYNATYNI
ncbi:MAG: hypothetical protein J0M33_16510 [Anaerolineae bacterium]|nr:hypothetical protein [Anaerolineae bacterium]